MLIEYEIRVNYKIVFIGKDHPLYNVKPYEIGFNNVEKEKEQRTKKGPFSNDNKHSSGLKAHWGSRKKSWCWASSNQAFKFILPFPRL